MVSRRTDRLLHMITHHTNLEQPFNPNISGNNYPAQNTEKLGRTIKLKYRNRYIPDIIKGGDIEIVQRNEDDELDTIYRSEFIILRCDLISPYKVIFLSIDHSVMLVGDSRTYENPDIVFKYPKQMEELIGAYVNNQYIDTPDVRTRAVVLSCDSTEPCNAIIAEFYIDNTVRFLLETEVQSIIMERHPLENRDYNGADPDDTIERIDINGGSFVIFDNTFIDVNGGFPDLLGDMLTRDALSFEEICKLRQKIIEERIIFGSEAIIPRRVLLNTTSETMYLGDNLELEATLDPPGSMSDITWRTTDESIVTVSPIDNYTATITSVGLGIARIYAIATDVWGRCIVDSRIHVSDITLDVTSFTIITGEERQINVTVLPENATNKNVYWISSDNSIATVENGLVKAKAAGTVTITCRATDGSGVFKNCEVTVQSNYVPVTSIRITNISGNPKRLNLSTNESGIATEYEVEVEILPADATDKAIYARVANPYEDFAVAIENITETKFKIKALCYCCEHLNIVEVYSHADSTKKDTVEVYVNTKLEDISLSKYNIELDPEFIENTNVDDTIDVLFYPTNTGIYSNIKAGVNRNDIINILNTLSITESSNNVIKSLIDTQSYLTNNCQSNRYNIIAGRPGTAIINITKPDNTVERCDITVGVPEINSINILNVPDDWSDIHIGDQFTVNLEVDPYYWYEYPDMYSITWSVVGTGAELITSTTETIIRIVGQCDNIKVIARSNNGIEASFRININS
jgi:uncharacterized protein YjdB